MLHLVFCSRSGRGRRAARARALAPTAACGCTPTRRGGARAAWHAAADVDVGED